MSCPIFLWFRFGGGDGGIELLLILLYSACVCVAIGYLFLPKHFDSSAPKQNKAAQ
jgi:hypothetical protein